MSPLALGATCPQCGTSLGEGYDIGDICLECFEDNDRFGEPPCLECGAVSAKDAETKCVCSGDKDDCHGCSLWPDD